MCLLPSPPKNDSFHSDCIPRPRKGIVLKERGFCVSTTGATWDRWCWGDERANVLWRELRGVVFPGGPFQSV